MASLGAQEREKLKEIGKKYENEENVKLTYDLLEWLGYRKRFLSLADGLA